MVLQLALPGVVRLTGSLGFCGGGGQKARLLGGVGDVQRFGHGVYLLC
jgi:hypothetical protein